MEGWREGIALSVPWRARGVIHCGAAILAASAGSCWLGADATARRPCAAFNHPPQRAHAIPYLNRNSSNILSRARTCAASELSGATTLNPSICLALQITRKRSVSTLLLGDFTVASTID